MPDCMQQWTRAEYVLAGAMMMRERVQKREDEEETEMDGRLRRTAAPSGSKRWARAHNGRSGRSNQTARKGWWHTPTARYSEACISTGPIMDEVNCRALPSWALLTGRCFNVVRLQGRCASRRAENDSSCQTYYCPSTAISSEGILSALQHVTERAGRSQALQGCRLVLTQRRTP